MRPRYLIAVSRGGALDPDLVGCLPRMCGLPLAASWPDLAIFAAPACLWLATGPDTGALGTLFARHGPPRPVRDDEAGEIGGLLDGNNAPARYWGGYLAVSRESGTRIARDPSGALPCYHVMVGRTLLLASEIDLLLATGRVRPALDWDAIVRRFHDADLPEPRTGLSAIHELLPGFALQADGKGGIASSSCWSPWDHVEPDENNGDGVAAERLRRLVRHCVQAWGVPFRHLLLSLSGGLDSSIVAACLAGGAAVQAVTCLTLFGDEAIGDERVYARALCAHLGLPLIEHPFRLDDVDIARPLGAHLPRPMGRTLAQAYEQAHLRAAAEAGIDAFMTGNGGDNVFCYSQSAAALVDRLRIEGFLPAWHTLRDIVAQTGCGPRAALAAAIRTARRPGPAWRANPLFLDRGLAAALAGRPFSHPWLEGPPGALPGKAAHIAGLLRLQLHLEPGRSRFAPVLHPLVSQPVMEACLKVPSWQWRAGGADRALAREAFAAQLPPEIRTRRLKGSPDAFGAALMRVRRAEIRARLLDGHLARHRLVDRGAIGAALHEDRQTTGEERVRLFDLLDTEAWLDHWSSRLAGTGEARASPR